MDKINTNWTLFLDRDGVINERIPGAYIDDWKDFVFRQRVPQSIAQFNQLFGRVVVVTNQQGIGKGLMSEAQLTEVHQRMESALSAAGARVDAIYFCPDLKTKANNCRKPAPQMAYLAKADYPEIDFQQSVMVGDSLSDIVFGNQLGMKTVLVRSNAEEITALSVRPDIKVDWQVDHLWELVAIICAQAP